MGTYDENIVGYLNSRFTNSYCVTNPHEAERIYEKYCRQLQQNGETPLPADQVLCMTTGMSCRDEDQDIPLRDATIDADYALSYIYKRHESKLCAVVLEIGLAPQVYVPKIPVANREERSL